MAQRRMFSLKVIDTDEFLDMPQSSQYLYYNLAMRADDDGFISNPKRIMRMIGCNDDDIKILTAKQYVIPFERGICVIRHWRIHNLIRLDRYTETEYLQEKSSLDIENGKYKLKTENVIPNGNQMIPQVRLGKDRIGNNIDDQFEKFWKKYPRKVSRKTAKNSWNKIKLTDDLFEKIMTSLEAYCQSEQWIKDDGKFIPHPATWLNQERWDDEIKVGQQKSNKFSKIKSTKV
jgi:hypothetical protein